MSSFRLNRFSAAFLAACLSYVVVLPLVFAQVPSTEQLEMLRALTPDEQRAILERFQRQTTGTVDRPLLFPEVSRPKPLPGEALVAPGVLAPEPLRIKGGDTVLLDLRLSLTERKLPQPVAPAPATTAPGQPAAQPVPQPPAQLATVEEQEDPVRAAQAKEELRRRAVELLPQDQIRALQAADQLRLRAMAVNPYKLDKFGQIWIPGLAGIPLAGLTAEQATERLALEPALELLTVKLTLLTLEPLGVDALRPFGYDVFSTLPTTFAPATDVPVPAEYVMGPGDTLKIQLLGNTKGEYELVVGRDGDVHLPDIGPVTVAGMTFPEARDALGVLVAEQMIGTRAVVSLGQLRSIKVLVTGEAAQPGSYTVSGLSTITNALFVSGGVKPIGSLRNIALKRAGRAVVTLDVYDLLLHGDARNDVRMLSSDVIFIPPVGTTVGVTGEIRRPAIYEVRDGATAADLVSLAGGLTPEADPRSARIERIDRNRGRVMIDVDLTADAGSDAVLQPGDVLWLDPVRPTLTNAVTVTGHVHRPGTFQYRPGLRIADLLTSVDDLRPMADLHYVLIRRELGPERRVTALSADIAAAWVQPQSEANVALAPRDQIIVFDIETGRDRLLGPILGDLEVQSVREQPSQTVGIGGRVRMPGQYPLEPGMTVSDLIRAGGSLDEAAFGGEAELTRYEVMDGEARQTVLIDISLAKALAGDAEEDIALQPFDFLVIKELSQWSDQETVMLDGEVQFPGRYPIRRGETLGSVLRRAGGVTDLAFVEGGLFTRTSLREREGKQIQALANRLQRDLAALSVQTSQVTQGGAQSAAQALVAGQSLLDELRKTEPVGRLVIDLAGIIRGPPGSPLDVVLKDGDRLMVPRQTQEVTVLGEVQSSTSHLYAADLDRGDYLNLSGGLTQKADAKRIYIVRANGGVVTASDSKWFGKSSAPVRPGDTIVVPLDAEKLPPLPLWTSVTTIIYNLAVAVAAVNSF